MKRTSLMSQATACGVIVCFLFLLCSQSYPQETRQDASDPAKLVQAGKKLIEEGEYERAIIVFLQALAEKGKGETADAYLYLAYSYYALNDSINCVTYIQKLLDLYPEKTVDDSLFPQGFISMYQNIKKDHMAKAPPPVPKKPAEDKPPVVKVKAQRENPAGKKKFPWLVVGGVVLVGAVIAVLLLSKKKTPVELKPDLVVSELTYNPENPSAEDLIDFTARVRNAGGARAGASALQLRIGGETFAPTYPVPALEPNATFAVTRSAQLSANIYGITATADVDNAVAESNESNNESTTTLTVYILSDNFDDGDISAWGFREGSGLTTNQAYSLPYALQVYSPIGSQDEAECYTLFDPLSTGKASFRFRMPSTANAPLMFVVSDDTAWAKYSNSRFILILDQAGTMSYRTNTVVTPFRPGVTKDIWHTLTMHWDTGRDQFMVSYDGEIFGPFGEDNSGGSITQLVFMKGAWIETGVFGYFDDVKIELAPGIGAAPAMRRR